jgi:hypothetical protein
MKHLLAFSLVVLLGAAFAGADVINIQDGQSVDNATNYGHFTGTIGYTAPSGSTTYGVLEISLTNLNTTTSGAAISAFAFNVNGDATVSQLLSAPSANWSLLSGPVNAQPGGYYEFGTTDNQSFQGGNAINGIQRGSTGTWDFKITGDSSVLAGLNANSFFSEYAVDQHGNPTSYAFIVRFQGGGISDKVPAVPGEPGTGVPLPSAAWGGLVLLGLVAVGKARKLFA